MKSVIQGAIAGHDGEQWEQSRQHDHYSQSGSHHSLKTADISFHDSNPFLENTGSLRERKIQ
jgi:hypothetical protein